MSGKITRSGPKIPAVGYLEGGDISDLLKMNVPEDYKVTQSYENDHM